MAAASALATGPVGNPVLHYLRSGKQRCVETEARAKPKRELSMLEDLPEELLECLLPSLDARGLATLMQVCTKLNKLAVSSLPCRAWAEPWPWGSLGVTPSTSAREADAAAAGPGAAVAGAVQRPLRALHAGGRGRKARRQLAAPLQGEAPQRGRGGRLGAPERRGDAGRGCPLRQAHRGRALARGLPPGRQRLGHRGCALCQPQARAVQHSALAGSLFSSFFL